MWGTREVLERLERLSRRFQDMDEFVSKELQRQRDKIALLEKEIVEIKWVKHRVKTLDSQVNDLMNREEEWKRRLAKIETRMIVDQMKVDGVWKEAEPKFNIDVGDLVVYKTNPTIIRTVTKMSVDHIKLENGNFQGLYSGSDWIPRFQMDWKLLVKKEDFK